MSPSKKSPARKVTASGAKKAAEAPAGAKKPVSPPAKTGTAARVQKAPPAPKPAPGTVGAPRSGSARTSGVSGPYAGDTKFLEDQRKRLLEERAIYQGQADDLRAEADSLALEREPGDVQFDEESGEGGTIAVDRERDLALSAQAMVTVEEIDVALASIDDGSYGACDQCGKPISKERLKALPYARLDVACKSGGLHRR